METGFYANRALWHLIWGGVFERFPDLTLVLTEQGTDWILPTLDRMEGSYRQMKQGRIGELGVPAEAVGSLSPKEIFNRNIWVGCELPGPDRCLAIPRDRDRQDPVGQRLPAPRGHLALQHRVAAAVLRRVDRSGSPPGPGRERRRGVRVRSRPAGPARRTHRPDRRTTRHPAERSPTEGHQYGVLQIAGPERVGPVPGQRHRRVGPEWANGNEGATTWNSACS